MCQVAVGLDHNLFLTKSGRIYACGWSGDGQTGIGIDEQPIVWDPLPVDGEINHHNVTSIYTGGDSSFAMTDENLIYAWGNNEYGQLTFTSNITQITTPTLIDTSFLDAPVKNICVGGSFTLFLTESGHVYTTGYSLVNNIHKFHLLTSNVKAVQCGLHYCITFSTDNVYTVWGTCPEKIRVRVDFLS
jgi:alpha-tubulin suppressor-like RCC1 family protein